MTSEAVAQFTRFLAVGAVNTLVGLLVIFGFMYFFDAAPVAANVAGYGVGFIVSFVLNREWSFRSGVRVVRALPRFLLVTLAAYAANLLVLIVLTAPGTLNPYVAQGAAMATYTVLSFLGCRWFVFRHGAQPQASAPVRE